MIIGGGRRNGENVSTYSKSRNGGNTVSPLTMFNEPPSNMIPFEEFTQHALERFSVLQLVESLASKMLKGSSEYYNKLESELRRIGFLKTIFCNSIDDMEPSEIAIDQISHFILRLAYCKTDELKKWFIQQEVDLFRYKLYKLSNDDKIIENFIKENNLKYSPISENEKQQITPLLIEFGVQDKAIQSQNYYKVFFPEVMDLIKQRRVIVKAGYAYVTISEFSPILTNAFRANLSLQLTRLSKHLKVVEEDQRINELLTILREKNVAESFTEAETRDQLTAESIEQHSVQSFPMCMRFLGESLKSNHHLKHYGRLQYGLFLKGIGLPLEENLRYWRQEFSKGSIPPEKFEKEYAYNIRHSYGKEGKRTSYTPYSCLKIITSHLPASGDYHGCPFKHFDKEFLKQKLRQYGRQDSEVGQIMDLVEGNGYQLACQRYFEFSHKTEETVAINHPNHYFEMSYRLIHGKSQPKAAQSSN